VFFPNPFNAGTVITYRLPEDGFVNCDIYDVVGRRVKTFGGKYLGAGMVSYFWDGTSDEGTRVSSGIYFGRLRYGGRSVVGKVMLVK